MRWFPLIAVLLAAVAPSALPASDTTIEYIAHACFRIQSPSGASVVVDPYNGNRWLGYGFPDSLDADAVLVTHPHYDHDASYYFGADVPVFRAPGEYSLLDIKIRGVEGRHAGPYGKEFGQRNTIWVIETGGIRIVHVGDSSPLSEEALRVIGEADVLMLPVDDLEHILKRGEVAEMRKRLHAKVILPMHYRLESLSHLPAAVGPIDEWLKGQNGVVRMRRNQVMISAEALPERPEVWVLPPSDEVEPWRENLHAAWRLRDQARDLRKKNPADPRAIELLGEAQRTAPRVIAFPVERAAALLGAGRSREAEEVLEAALVSAGRSDWEYTMQGRFLLAGIYRDSGRDALAAVQYRLILSRAYRTPFREAAEAFLRSRRGGRSSP